MKEFPKNIGRGSKDTDNYALRMVEGVIAEFDETRQGGETFTTGRFFGRIKSMKKDLAEQASQVIMTNTNDLFSYTPSSYRESVRQRVTQTISDATPNAKGVVVLRKKGTNTLLASSLGRSITQTDREDETKECIDAVAIAKASRSIVTRLMTEKSHHTPRAGFPLTRDKFYSPEAIQLGQLTSDMLEKLKAEGKDICDPKLQTVMVEEMDRALGATRFLATPLPLTAERITSIFNEEKQASIIAATNRSSLTQAFMDASRAITTVYGYDPAPTAHRQTAEKNVFAVLAELFKSDQTLSNLTLEEKERLLQDQSFQQGLGKALREVDRFSSRNLHNIEDKLWGKEEVATYYTRAHNHGFPRTSTKLLYRNITMDEAPTQLITIIQKFNFDSLGAPVDVKAEEAPKRVFPTKSLPHLPQPVVKQAEKKETKPLPLTPPEKESVLKYVNDFLNSLRNPGDDSYFQTLQTYLSDAARDKKTPQEVEQALQEAGHDHYSITPSMLFLKEKQEELAQSAIEDPQSEIQTVSRERIVIIPMRIDPRLAEDLNTEKPLAKLRKFEQAPKQKTGRDAVLGELQGNPQAKLKTVQHGEEKTKERSEDIWGNLAANITSKVPESETKEASSTKKDEWDLPPGLAVKPTKTPSRSLPQHPAK